ncbi:hypothetical protein BZA05DRAFT_411589 [Tricharina praecox]|uniref:uncharacterized protein n=1 Tax=Tricharina praecox TaxID=43433 RepID=UPI0022202F93|nr:uncharacterized protein BZA05DRAFT_411589 [Tricharina praecox]KAI5842831.1 hypothetical protein BZA05DRAFT_411589 [Tricharina praecox]
MIPVCRIYTTLLGPGFLGIYAHTCLLPILAAGARRKCGCSSYGTYGTQGRYMVLKTVIRPEIVVSMYGGVLHLAQSRCLLTVSLQNQPSSQPSSPWPKLRAPQPHHSDSLRYSSPPHRVQRQPAISVWKIETGKLPTKARCWAEHSAVFSGVHPSLLASRAPRKQESCCLPCRVATLACMYTEHASRQKYRRVSV